MAHFKGRFVVKLLKWCQCAGTGHAGFMEPNYTKEVKNSDGSLKTVTTEPRLRRQCRVFCQKPP